MRKEYLRRVFGRKRRTGYYLIFRQSNLPFGWFRDQKTVDGFLHAYPELITIEAKKFWQQKKGDQR